jgi:tetratricopeptide (TPR) repeat protein
MKRDVLDYFDELVPWLPYTALIVVAAFALRRLDDFDTWWHLASGRWIAQHHAVPTTDVLSFTVRNNEWVNLQWLYDLLLYAIYSLAGAGGLVIASAACFIATFAILARHLGRTLGPVASTALLLWVAATVNERFLIRPEMASFPLLAAVQLVLADGRENPKRLRWLVPLMVVWANTHSLFIVGVAAIAAAIGGALLAETQGLPARWREDSAWPAASRRTLLIWGGAAIGATLANPYLLRAWLFPIELMRRIDGSNGAYLAIGEFRPPFSGYFPTFALGSYQVMIFALLALAALAGWLAASSRRDEDDPSEDFEERFDVAPLAFAAALAWLSLLARRNIGLFAIGILPFLGSTLGIVLARMPRVSSTAVRVAGFLVLASAFVLGAQAATNGWYARTGETHEFGLGVFKSNFQTRATQFFREQKLPGPTYNDMTTGGYLTWDDPSGKGVYIDGRLEVYDTPFFTAYLSHFTDIESWKREVDRLGIQTATIFHRWEVGHSLIRAVDATGEWLLVYYDETVVIFVRAAPANADVIDAARDAFAKTWLPRNDAALTGPRQAARWQWGIDRMTGQMAYARALETIGDTKEAVIWFQVALAGDLPPRDEVEARQHAADGLVALGEPAQARVHLVRALELDPANDVTLDMLRRLNELGPQ